MLAFDLDKMKELRQRKHLTLMDMSEALGYESPNGYFYLEQGRIQIKANQLATIARVLEVDIQDLYSQAA